MTTAGHYQKKLAILPREANEQDWSWRLDYGNKRKVQGEVDVETLLR